MKVLDGPVAGWAPQRPPNAVTIGVFDGVHIGHRSVLGKLTSLLLPSTVLTFDPHPAVVLSPGFEPRLITTIDERLALLEQAGVDTVGVLDLAEVRRYPPERFVSEVLLAKLGVRSLVVGADFHFGRDRAGDVAYLRKAGERHGFEVLVVDLVESAGVVSSTRIRRLIEAGDVSGAAALLGTRFRLSNDVVDGDKRGRLLGFPTANLRPPPGKVIPGNGVYAAFVEIGHQDRPSAVNVGVRPTFGASELLIEAYVLDFDGDLYGRELTVEFVEKLRPELEFDDIDDLVEQMTDDVARARLILDSSVST
ncbi:MAG: bifunctional riboflavin kinase/FAD synthetase [Acidimicrobiia bacterium]